ncbi:MAG: hypothetical protein PHX08_15080 [Lachnospiraceae bacterium]|nr:hypothetical protein [Lachnospiraceae bacterium]
MKKRVKWLCYGAERYLRIKSGWLQKLWMKNSYNFCHRKSITTEDANKQLGDLLENNQNVMVARLGFFELAAMRNYEFERSQNYSLVMKQLSDCAGFFPQEERMGQPFLTEMKQSLSSVDMLLASGEPFENYFIDYYTAKKTQIIPTFHLTQPWMYQNPWTSHLKGKKVLVIHPFEHAIRQQYERRELLFLGTDILPKFELQTYCPVVSVGEYSDTRFEDWFAALEYMFREIKEIDFDVALLGCGAYGFPLAARIRNMGRTAIHVGGNLQLFFGIMGKRWDGSRENGQVKADLRPFYNENWIYPSEAETPSESNKVEYGPYWK